MSMSRSTCGGQGKNPPLSPSVTFINGNPIKSNAMRSPSVTSIIDGFPIRAMPHLAAVTEVGPPNAPPDPDGHEDSEDLIRAMPHLAAVIEVGSPDAPPDPEGYKDSEEARGSSLSPSLLQYDTDAPIKNEEEDNNTTNTNPSILHLEGVEEFEWDALCHVNTFYALLKPWYCQKDYTSVLLTKAGYDKRVAFGVYLINGGDCRSSFMAVNTAAYEWAKKYHVVTVGQKSEVLVLCPSTKQGTKKKGMVDMTTMRLDNLQHPTYVKRPFADLWKIHQEDHCKGNTLFTCARDWHGNITQEVCKMFTNVCPHCI
jgi:hypothetical protein